MRNKYFIITIDTEADNQWDSNQKCSTENSHYLPRFQELSEKYNYKPVWLTTYEMANDDFFVEYFKNKQDENLCEIGMHLHAWNTPPNYEIDKKTNERSYLIEYPKKIMDEKIKNLDNLLIQKFGQKPISHRSGRWATNESYFELLSKYGYKIDCSVTPHIDWKKSLGLTGIGGTNYKNNSEQPYMINNELMEVPLTIKRIHNFRNNKKGLIKFLKEIIHYILGRYQWVRPDKTFDKESIKNVIKKCDEKNEYIMFMIHSSELMPNGSPNFKTEEDIEKLYEIIECIFKYAKDLGYIGITLKEFYERNK